MSKTEWQAIARDLVSEDSEVRLAAILRSGKVRAPSIPSEVVQLLVRLLSDPDEAIKAEAIRSLGLHWSITSIVPNLVQQLNTPCHNPLKLVTITSLGALGVNEPDLCAITLSELAKFVLDDRWDESLRVVAYLEMLRVAKRITFEQYLELDLALAETLSGAGADIAWVRDAAGAKP